MPNKNGPGEFLTPQWLKEIDSDIKAMVTRKNMHELASLIGTMLGLLDYTRTHMPADNWEYVHSQLLRELSE